MNKLINLNPNLRNVRPGDEIFFPRCGTLKSTEEFPLVGKVLRIYPYLYLMEFKVGKALIRRCLTDYDLIQTVLKKELLII